MNSYGCKYPSLFKNPSMRNNSEMLKVQLWVEQTRVQRKKKPQSHLSLVINLNDKINVWPPSVTNCPFLFLRQQEIPDQSFDQYWHILLDTQTYCKPFYACKTPFTIYSIFPCQYQRNGYTQQGLVYSSDNTATSLFPSTVPCLPMYLCPSTVSVIVLHMRSHTV